MNSHGSNNQPVDDRLPNRAGSDNLTIDVPVGRPIAASRRWIVGHVAEIACGLVLTLMALQMLVVISRKSITNDEIVLIPSAYYHLVGDNYRLVNEHPPLSKIVAGTAFLFVQPNEGLATEVTAENNPDYERWQYYLGFWEHNRDRFEAISFWPRVPMILLTVALGVLVFRFARELFGARAAVLAVVLFACEPTVLAHGRVVQTDVPAAFGWLLFFMALSAYAKQATFNRAIYLGIAAAVAILSKFSMLLAGPVLAVFFLILLARALRAREKVAMVVTHAGLIVLTILVVINAAYFFQHRSLDDSDTRWINMAFPGNAAAVTTVERLLAHLLPTDFVLGVFFQFWHNGVGHAAGLLGMYSQMGWWYYFPVAFALKSTLPFLALALASLGWGTYKWIKRRETRFFWLLLPFAIYTAFVLFSHIDIGVRYYLPAYSFLFILSGGLLDALLRSKRVRRAGMVIAVALIAWIAVEAIRAHPNQMSYMNQLASRAPHWWYLSDSNVEWGDDARGLAEFLHARGETSVG
ncbi:MAG TPA: glycosyltransferase family 39 protein, partial [Pyrinomonadaceae bacterium]|nr:glycosyltransferase family 39 protein [Pyrinomonadaceae bacterium]